MFTDIRDGVRRGLFAAAALIVFTTFAPAIGKADAARVSVFPTPGTPVASEMTTFSFRGMDPGRLGPVRIVGSRSGRVGIEKVVVHSDRQGVSVVPTRIFVGGETVRVYTNMNIAGARNGDFKVKIGRYLPPSIGFPLPDDPVVGGLNSRPDLKPPPINVIQSSPELEEGQYFLGILGYGLTIMNTEGKVSWFQPILNGFSDFRPQMLGGQRVLTYYSRQTDKQPASHIILDRSYQPIYKVNLGNGFPSDAHEFDLTSRNTALIISYRPLYWNLSGMGGAQNAVLLDNIVQEVDIATGAVLFEWHTVGNVPLDSSGETPPANGASWDPTHLNSIDDDGNSLLISARRTSAIYRVDKSTGRIRWTLRGDGGPSSFQMGPGVRFIGQHDARRLPNGDISILDNSEIAPPGDTTVPASAMELRLSGNTALTREAALISNFSNPDGLTSPATGSNQVRPDGSRVVSWGTTPFISEFGPAGEVLFHANTGMTYRVAKATDWHGTPAGRPAIASKSTGGTVTVYASWNGAQDIDHWTVLSGSGQGSMTEVASAPWDNLETAIPAGAAGPRVQVVAYSADNQVLGRSQITVVGQQSD